MPTAPGGARRVGVALWEGAPTVPRGAGWGREKGQSANANDLQFSSAELIEPHFSPYRLRTTRLLKSLAASAALYPRRAP